MISLELARVRLNVSVSLHMNKSRHLTVNTDYSFAVSFSSLEEGPRVGDIEMCNEEGESIGTLDVSIEFEAGDGA